MKTIQAYCGEWHLSVSSAFHELLVEGLKDHLDVRLVSIRSLNPQAIDPDQPLVFCQVPPPDEALKIPGARIVWLPMWDDARNYAPQVWENFPKSVRIAAFSEHLGNVTRRAGFQVLDLKYYKDPALFPPVQWDGERVLFYWNRTGMVGPGFLEKLCHCLSVDQLIFRGDIDPIYGESIRYRLPERLNGTSVESLPFLQSKEAYYRALDRANLVIAPRLSEGIGMVFLEALARGCTVFAADSATMNEYITHGEDGYLLPSLSISPEGRQAPGFAKKALTNYPITDLQNWDEIAQLDVAKVGKTARENHAAGFARWKASQGEFARFITEWN